MEKNNIRNADIGTRPLNQLLCFLMVDMENIFERIAAASLLPGFIWLFITIHALHFSETRLGRFRGVTQFWPFYKEMRSSYPVSSRWARVLTYISTILILPWLIVKVTGI